VAEYITKFDEFLVRCDENESDIVVLSRFCAGREDLRCELFVQDISTLEQAYLVQDLDRSNIFFTRRTLYE